MADKRSSDRSHNTDGEGKRGATSVYQIRLQGHLGRQWTAWFEGMTIRLEDNGETLLTGEVVDQAALYGLLSKLRDVGIPLLSIVRLRAGRTDGSDVDA